MADRTELGSKVASGSEGVTVKRITGLTAGFIATFTGWKGVGVGVASGGIVTSEYKVGMTWGVEETGVSPQAETSRITRQNRQRIRVCMRIACFSVNV